MEQVERALRATADRLRKAAKARFEKVEPQDMLGWQHSYMALYFDLLANELSEGQKKFLETEDPTGLVLPGDVFCEVRDGNYTVPGTV